jgi:hypothetical protein
MLADNLSPKGNCYRFNYVRASISGTDLSRRTFDPSEGHPMLADNLSPMGKFYGFKLQSNFDKRDSLKREIAYEREVLCAF